MALVWSLILWTHSKWWMHTTKASRWQPLKSGELQGIIVLAPEKIREVFFRSEGLQKVKDKVKSFDWTFTTEYNGTYNDRIKVNIYICGHMTIVSGCGF